MCVKAGAQLGTVFVFAEEMTIRLAAEADVWVAVGLLNRLERLSLLILELEPPKGDIPRSWAQIMLEHVDLTRHRQLETLVICGMPDNAALDRSARMRLLGTICSAALGHVDIIFEDI